MHVQHKHGQYCKETCADVKDSFSRYAASITKFVVGAKTHGKRIQQMYRINNNNTSCLMYSAKETWENLLLCDAKKMIE